MPWLSFFVSVLVLVLWLVPSVLVPVVLDLLILVVLPQTPALERLPAVPQV